MEILLAIIVFGILFAITVWGYIQSRRAATHGTHGSNRMAMSGGGHSGGRSDTDRPPAEARRAD